MMMRRFCKNRFDSQFCPKYCCESLQSSASTHCWSCDGDGSITVGIATVRSSRGIRRNGLERQHFLAAFTDGDALAAAFERLH